MSNQIPKAYEPGKIEEKWYNFWLEQGYFTPKIDPSKKPFVVIMPPPNVTGELHLGHALTDTLEDIMVRWHRMKGEPTLWLPGTDHAGIATQVVVEQELAKQGLTKNDIGREKFLRIIWEWANKSRRNINSQHQMLGTSCDWTRDCFTLDEGPSRAVRTAFVRLYNKGLIYRGERIINWCPRCQTALSDLEVDYKSITGHLYYVRYPLTADSSQLTAIRFVTVATTRPETLLGDTAVAVNPKDRRYENLVGKDVILPLVNKKIPVIADDAVDPFFGTGVLKITPAHDPTDFEVAERHNLPLVNIMNLDATMNENAGPYVNLERFVCRDKVVADLKDKGLLEKIEPYPHSVGHCNRCQTMIEPKASRQWFIRTSPLAEAAIKAVKEGDITIVPERFTKVYFDWMENIRDWCISRQLWWGHRIPVWHCQDCSKLTASADEPLACEHCGSNQIVQDPDVLDTWFSSGLWTHSTLGWPDDTDDLRYFYPTSVMETGYDILFFWVARMIMMGLEDTGEIPFHTVYLHGLLRDENGEKMSKLRGNVINPTEAISEYGVDALRFALIIGSSPGNDINLGQGRLKSSRNFANKLWNATRFIFQSIDAEALKCRTLQVDVIASEAKQTQGSRRVEDRWIHSQLNRLIINVTKLMEDFQFGEAEQQIHDFIWSEFCDWYIEFAKIRLGNQSPPSPLPFLVNTLGISLRLLHPSMPFITEELWQSLKQRLPNKSQMPASIMIAPYPTSNEKAIDPEAEKAMDAVIEIIRSIRNARSQYKVAPAKWIKAQVYADNHLPYITSQAKAIETLARARPLAILNRQERKAGKEKALILVLKEAEVVLPWTGMIDQLAEKKRLIKEKELAQARIAQLNTRLRDNAFLTKAPPHIVEKEKQKLYLLKDKLERLKSELSQLD
ncbi:Valine--tRNA ligase [subsurface metagenome]|nr:valine--tRNA ligase [Dehalococcoidia bacterium]